MEMFEMYPVAKYWWDKVDEDFLFRNIFLKLELLEYLRDNPTVLSNYVLKADESPWVLADKLYGNPKLHWTILLVNDVVDPNEWVMDTYQFNAYIKEKYDDQDGKAFTVRNGEIDDLKTNQFFVQKNPFKTYDSLPDPSLTDPQKYDTISYLESETMVNDNKRVVKAIRKEFMPAFLKDFERKIKSLEGK